MKKNFNFKKWVKAATVRAIKTMAQSAVALIEIGRASCRERV